MVVAAFYIITFFVEIIFIIKSIIKKDIKLINIASNINKAMLLSIILFIIYMIKMSGKLGLTIVITYIILIVAILIFYVPLLIVNCIIKYIMNKKQQKLNIINSGADKNKESNVFGIILCLTIIILVIDSIPYSIKMKSWDEIKEETVEYLTLKYGDGNFNVEKMKDTEEQLNFYPTSSDYKYVLTVSSSYMNDEFEVTIDKDSLEIENEEFLETYYGAKSSFKYYLRDYFLEELNNQLSENYNATIKSYDYEANYDNINFGHVPSLDELSEYINFIIPKFEINEEMASAEELLEYITEISTFYITDLQRDYFTYNSQNKYIIFLYNYSNLEGLASNHYIHVRFSSDDSTITIQYLDETFSYDISDMIYVNE